MRKGRAPRAIVNISYLGTTPCRTNRFKPKGGVTSPISARTTKATPNQIGLKPRLRISGPTKGRVNTIIERESKNIPKMIYMKKIMTSMLYLPRGRFNINVAKASVSPI